eukprot:RCo051221
MNNISKSSSNKGASRGPPSPLPPYTPEELRTAAHRADFAVIVDNAETQGYALQQLMLMDLPLLVVVLSERQLRYVVPYFDHRCGSVATATSGVAAVKDFLDRLPSFRPREAMLEMVSPQASVGCFVRRFCGLLGRGPVVEARDSVPSVVPPAGKLART